MTRPIRILELRSVRGTGGGPEKTILHGTAETDPRRFAVTVCYLRDRRDPVFGIDTKAAGLPIDYTEIVERHSLDPSIWPRLRELVRTRAIDIVHAHDYKTDLLAWLLSKSDDVIALSTVHGWTGHTQRERWVYYPLDKCLLSLFPKLVAVSGEVRNELIRHGARPQDVVTVLNGIDHTVFRRDPSRQAASRRQLGIAEHEFVIGTVGRLEPQKRFDVLIDAFAGIHLMHSNARLLIAGDGSLRGALDAQVANHGLSGSCRLLGHRTDITELHHAFDLFVQSSVYEGTPNAVLEAMALETPIVATDAGGTAEICRHSVEGLIVPAGDPVALGDAMHTVLNDPDAARARAARARSRVETDLSFDRRMRSVEDIYVELFERRCRTNTAAAVAART
jgi:glycosyltransferase involved in cell wall biosynthesis